MVYFKPMSGGQTLPRNRSSSTTSKYWIDGRISPLPPACVCAKVFVMNWRWLALAGEGRDEVRLKKNGRSCLRVDDPWAAFGLWLVEFGLFSCIWGLNIISSDPLPKSRSSPSLSIEELVNELRTSPWLYKNVPLALPGLRPPIPPPVRSVFRGRAGVDVGKSR